MNPYIYFKELIFVTFKRYINNIETYLKLSNKFKCLFLNFSGTLEYTFLLSVIIFISFKIWWSLQGVNLRPSDYEPI